MDKPRIRLTVDATPEFNANLERLARDCGCSKSEILRKAFALFDASHQAVKAGKKVGVARTGDTLETEFVGL